MAGSAILKLLIMADASSAVNALSKTTGSADTTTSRIGGMFKRLGGIIAATFTVDKILDFGKQSIQSAKDQGAAVSAVTNIYGKGSAAVIKWSNDSANRLGLSKTAALQAAGGFGTLGSAAGLTGRDLSKFGTNITERAVDIAAFYKKPPEDVFAALQAGLKGNTRPLKQFGIMVDQNTLKQRALKMGLINTEKDALTPQQKTLAMYAEIMDQTSKTQGKFKDSTDSLGVQQRILSAEYENFKAAIGSKLIPILLALVKAFQSVAHWAAENKTFILLVAAAAGTLIAALKWNSIVSGIKSTITAVKGMGAALNALSANPVILIIAGIIALVAAFIYAYKHSETFRNIVKAVFNAVLTAARAVANFFTQTIPRAFTAIWDGIKSVWDKVWSFLKTWGPVALAALVPFIGIPLLIWKNFDKIVGWLKGVWDKVKQGISGLFDIIKKPFVTAWNWLSNFVSKWAGKIGDWAKNIGIKVMQGLRTIWDRVTAPFKKAWDWLSSHVSGWAGNVARFMRNIVSKIVSGLRAVWEKVSAPFKRAWDWVSSHVSGWAGNIARFMSNIVSKIASGLRTVWDKVSAPFKRAWDWVSSTVGDWASRVGNFVGRIPGAIGRALSSLWDKFTSPFKRAYDWVKESVSRVGDFFTGIPGAIGRALSGIFDTITAPFKRAWDWVQNNIISPIKTAWNTIANAINAVPDWSFKIPSWVPGLGGKGFTLGFPDLPKFATGAYVYGPTFAMVGETGNEWVLPDAKLRALLRQELSNLGTTVIVNGALDPDAVARQIEGILRSRSRRQSGVVMAGTRTL